ncbi:2-dehydro-3-deoxyglucarate aldolase [Comamonadaceae bacterium OH2545_COT-014]|nr:2-dehydro-3-deoxyglucarate aldolase [Comamonadaceae bacterium OH2545_COT-014]
MTFTTPTNRFKQALAARQTQIGFWLNLSDLSSTEICAGAGFDWLLVDTEHAPNDLHRVQAQLQTVAAYPATQAVVRVGMAAGPLGDMLIKQTLDLGAQTIMAPMVDTAEQAAAVVGAARYPQADGGGGKRGMAGARASHWGRNPRYAQEANAQVCVLVQAETRTALEHLDAIAATPGVDGVFIGPADLSASLGHVGDAGHPAVQAAIADAFARIAAKGKAAGILASDEGLARHYLELGATFVAVGLDTQLLATETSALAARYKGGVPVPAAPRGGVY